MYSLKILIYLSFYILLISTINCSTDWTKLGITYANNEDSERQTNRFHGITDSRPNFSDKSGPELRAFEQQMIGRHETNDKELIRNDNSVKSIRKPISLAIKSKRTLNIIPYSIERQEYEPQIIEITSQPMPLSLHFKTHSSRLSVHQTHTSNSAHSDGIEKSTHDRPYRMRHRVITPLIQEVIQPNRHFVQHIEPVIQNIKTFVMSEKRDNSNRHSGSSNTGAVTTTTDAQHNNHFNSDFESHYPKQDFVFRGIEKQIDSNQRVNNQRSKPNVGFNSNISASNPTTIYTIIPLLLKRSEFEQNIGPNHQLNEDFIRRKLYQVYRYLH